MLETAQHYWALRNEKDVSHTHDFFFLKKLQTVKSIFENDPLEIDDFEAKEFCGRV